MLWSEIGLKDAMWRIGAERTKNGLLNEVPLSAPAVTILSALNRREGRDRVFGARDGAFQGWSNAKTALDARMSATLGHPPEAWRLHDIRRTVATRFTDLGVLPHVVEAVLNHISGSPRQASPASITALRMRPRNGPLDGLGRPRSNAGVTSHVMIPPNFVSLRKVYSIFAERYDSEAAGRLTYLVSDGNLQTFKFDGREESRRCPLSGGKTRVTIRDKIFLLTELYQK